MMAMARCRLRMWPVVLLHALFASAQDAVPSGQNPVEQIASVLREAKARGGMASAPASGDIGQALSQALGGAMRNAERSNDADPAGSGASLENMGGLNGLGQMFQALSSATAQAAGGPHTGAGTNSAQSGGNSGDGCSFHCQSRSLVKVQDPDYQLWSNGCGTAGMNMDMGFDFAPCCDRHDACYETCGMPKGACDRLFKGCMKKVCRAEGGKYEECVSASSVFTAGVGIFGCGSYLAGQQQACLCVPRQQAWAHLRSHIADQHTKYDTKNFPPSQRGLRQAKKRAESLLTEYGGVASTAKGEEKTARLMLKLSRRFSASVKILRGSTRDPNQPLISRKTMHGTYKDQAIAQDKEARHEAGVHASGPKSGEHVEPLGVGGVHTRKGDSNDSGTCSEEVHGEATQPSEKIVYRRPRKFGRRFGMVKVVLEPGEATDEPPALRATLAFTNGGGNWATTEKKALQREGKGDGRDGRRGDSKDDSEDISELIHVFETQDVSIGEARALAQKLVPQLRFDWGSGKLIRLQ